MKWVIYRGNLFGFLIFNLVYIGLSLTTAIISLYIIL